MSTTEKKPQPNPGQTIPPSPPPSSQVPPSATPASRGPMISRRMFLQAAVGGSAVLVAASLATSGGILGPLIPPAKGPATIANIYDAELDPAKATNFVEGPWDECRTNSSTGPTIPPLAHIIGMSWLGFQTLYQQQMGQFRLVTGNMLRTTLHVFISNA